MKKIYLLSIFCCLNIAAYAQFPVAYWSFEDATHAAQSLAVTDQITGTSGAAAGSVVAAGGIGTASTAGAGAVLHAGSAGLGINSGAVFNVASSGTAPTAYWAFNFTNTSIGGTMTLTFDAMESVAGLTYSVLYSITGGAPYTAVTTGALSTTWTTKTVTLPASANSVIIYAYGSTTSTMSLDNVAILAATTSTNAVFTTADEADIYNMYTSGGTGQYSRNSIVLTGAATNVTINNNSATSGISMNPTGIGNVFNVTNGSTVTFGTIGMVSGLGGLALDPGCTLVTANLAGIAATGTFSGSVQTAARNFNQGANYVFNGAAAQNCGTGLPAIISSPGSVTIDNPTTVTLTPPGASTTIQTGATLNLVTGTFVNTAANLKMQSGSFVNCDNGLLLVPATTYSGVTLTYMNLGPNTLAVTTNNEWPPVFNGNVIVNKPLATVTLNGNKANSGYITLTAGTLDASVSNYNISLTGTWTNNSSLTAFTARSATVTILGGLPLTLGGIYTTTFNNFTLNASTGVTVSLGVTENVFGTFTLTNGFLVLNSYNLVLGTATPAVAGTPSSTAEVVATSTGQVQKLMTGNGSFLFPVGDTSSPSPHYSPITLNFTAGTYAAGAYAGVNLRNAKHPANANVTNYINRYWTVGLSGITAPSYIVNATYSTTPAIATDVVGTEANIAMGQYIGSLPWIKYGLTNTLTHTLTTSSAVSNITSDFTGIDAFGPNAGASPNIGICIGNSTTLSGATTVGDPTLTYAWSPSTGLSATTGVTVTATPTVTTTYTLTVTDGNGFTGSTSTTVSVNANPTTITGNPVVCVGLTTSLNSTPASGTWSSSNGNATVNTSTGVVTGVTAGTATISYIIGGVCYVTTPVTVNANPTTITGTTNICTGATSTLNSTPAGGTWSSSNANATIGSSSGVLSGALAGTAIITYTLNTGCINTTVVTVNSQPTTITGTTNVCVGLTTTLNTTPAGGVWSSSNGNATINPVTGVVTGAIAGTSTITNTIGGVCTVTTPVTVNPNPTAITGTLNVCVGATTTLNSTPAGGTWSSSNGNASVGSSTGIVTGVAQGTSVITYTLGTGCIITGIVTVNPDPTTITGTLNVCIGLTTTLNSTPAGGTWSSSNSNVIIGSSTGVVTGEVAGTSAITYMLATGCINATPTIVTVNPSPTAITGTLNVCVGLTTTLNSTPAGGTWSSSNGNVAIGSSTGIATGNTQGTATITYTAPTTGCTITAVVTVNPNPTTITGTLNVCVGLTTTLNSTPAGGTWTANNSNANVGITSGIVTGIIPGTDVITYTLATGCINTAIVTVNANPTNITGTEAVCVGLTTTLNSTPAGGTWTSSNPAIAAIGSSSGIVTGALAGTVFITYTLGTGCINATPTIVTVNPNPTTITGNLNVCVGLTTTLNSTPAGGTWTSSNGNATIGSSTGILTGITPGTDIITYTLATGCINTAIVTINANPTNITGTETVCVGLTTTLNSTPAGGTWTSSNTTVAIIGSSSGIVTGELAGTAFITYTLSTGCINATPTIVTVNANPTAITGTLNVCVGATTTLNSTPAGGTWTSSNGNASIGSTTGIVTGNIPGTSIITYTLATGCINTAIVTVNANPTTITGTTNVCVGLTTTLNSTPGGGAWSSSNTNATVGSSTGIVTGAVAGTATITYVIGSTCYITTPVTVNPNPTGITGTLNVCVGLTTTLNSTPAGGTWSSNNGNATIGSSTGIVTGITAGTSVITYTLSTGCITTAIVTVNPNPTTITGSLNVCIGLTTTLNSTPAGGTWSSSNTNVFIGVTSGIATGILAGTATITYTLSTGCINTAIVTVNPNPTAITGVLSVCVGLTTTLNSTPAGGTWSSSNGNATVGSSTGIVTGVTAGTSIITYMLSTGCINTAIVTVNPNPTTITGTEAVCVGLTTTLNSTPAGGTWTSSNTTIAIIGSSTGIVTGELAGTVFITYTLSTGCINATPTIVTVNPNPTTITGNPTVCVGATTTLNSTPAGGTWSSSNGNATVGSSTGIVTGMVAGTATITYMIATGCISTIVVTVNTTPSTITGATNVCVGLTTTLNSTPAGGTWSSNNGNATVGSTTGIVTGVIPGTSIITYSLATGCFITTTVTVNPNPTNITGVASVCVGLTTTLNSTPAGGTWSSSNGNATIGSSTGIVTGVIAGTSVITYTLSTGCITTTIVTVNPNPTTITGVQSICIGASTTLNSTPAGGTWTSSNGNVIIGSSTGIATGVFAGTSVITYTISTGCINTTIVTVDANPTNITGILNVCVGLSTTLNSTPAGGTWSSSNSNAIIGSSSGIATGVLAGTSIITYTNGATCYTTTILTINPLPLPISGTLTVCVGLTTSLTDGGGGGGTWSASNGHATIGSISGLVTGVSAGTDVITYTLPTGCMITAVVTVDPLPSAISGTLVVCAGLTTSLSDVPAGGTWGINPTSVATIGSSSGIVTGGNVSVTSTATVTYTISTGCSITAVVTVNPLPAAISGTLTVCVGLTTTLSDVGGGTWTASNGNATVGLNTGIVTGVTAGTDVITYTLPTGCITTAVVTVNPLPTAILGNLSVCSGLTTSLTDLTTGGTWMSSNTSAGTINSISGVVTADTVLTTSTTTITYTLGTGCIITATVTVNPLPTPILGILNVCVGQTTTLNDLTPGGTWTSDAPGTASVVSSTGIVTGVTADTATILYTITSTGCTTTAVVTVNPLPSAILGTLSVCSGLTTALSDLTTGGTWSSSGNATVDTNGIVTGGAVSVISTATITYTLSTGCITTAVVTVDPLPTTIMGTLEFCAGVTTTLTDATLGGTWTSSDVYIAPIGLFNGTIFGSSGGTVTITYTMPSGCYITTIVTVDPLPGAILGDLVVCQGLTTSLSDLTPSGTWSIAPPGVANISTSGLVTGTAAGTTIVTYTLATGCAVTAILTVNPLPSNINGTMTVCVGLTTALTDATTGGVWTSSDPLIASVDPSTGIVTGEMAGTATITYTISTGCIATTTVTVNPLPSPILGSAAVCVGLTTSLSDVGGGTWSMSNGDATINAGSGVVTGVAGGLDTAIYTLPTGCIATTTVTVYALPSTISGTLSVCAGLTTSLTDSPLGGNWSSSDTSIAVVDASGNVTGKAVTTTSTVTITYNLATGCNATAVVTVNPLPTAILGVPIVCVTDSVLLTDASGGGTWSSSAPGIGSANAATGWITGVSAGTTTITYTLPTGCITTRTETVTAPPAPITGTETICFGTQTDLNDASPGGIWSSGNIFIATVGTNGVVTPTGSGTVTISYSLAAGCVAQYVVTINPLPQQYTIFGGGTYCQGGSGVPIGLSGSNVGISYLLFYDTSHSATGYLAGTGDSLHFGLLTVAGTYTILATNNTTGCSIAMLGSVNVTISPTVNPEVSIITGLGDTVCPGTSVKFIPVVVHGGTPTTFQWSVNGVVVSLDSTYTYIPANGDSITVTIVSNRPCVTPQTATGKYIIHVIPDGNPGVSITIDPGDTVCQYAAATFTATATFGGPDPIYIWYVNGHVAGSGPILSYVPTSGDIVYCKMVSDYECRTTDTGYSNVAVMHVVPLIIPHVDVLSSRGFNIEVGQYDTLRTVIANAGTDPTYQWEVNGVPVAGATVDTFVSQFNNYDSVTCVITSSGYCHGVSTFGWIFISVYPVGVQQVTLTNNDIKLIPNPNKGTFTIRGTFGSAINEEVTAEITDMIGQVVYKNKIMVNDGKIDEQIRLNNTMANGMYLLSLRSGSDNIVFHFVIEQ